MKTHFILCLVIAIQLFTQDTYAQQDYVKGDIHLLNGEKIETNVGFPIFNDYVDRIGHIRQEGAEEEIIKSNDINYIVLYSGDEKKILKRAKTYKRGGKKLRKFYSWLSLVAGCRELQTYHSLVGYDIDEEGNFLDIYREGVGYLAMLRKGEDYPTEVGMIVHKDTRVISMKTFEKQRHKHLSAYFKGDKSASAFLKKNTRVTMDDFYSLVNIQCSGEAVGITSSEKDD